MDEMRSLHRTQSSPTSCIMSTALPRVPEGIEVALANVEHGAEAEELGAFRTLHGGHENTMPMTPIVPAH